ncbi:MAG: ATP-binding cassette domain-containing protein [Prevotella sp.]|nr:ATP-binding cassette domain-containing protein [Prevotella sp.]
MIQIDHLDFGYPGSKHQVFGDFSLTLHESNIYGLFGKNGTGKSTLLYLLCGLLRAKRGTILVDGKAAGKRQPDMLRDIFLIPEEFELPNVKLSTYVDINRGFYPLFSQQVLDSCLRDFELPLSLKLGELSMGQKKKVYMSFALATGTRLLLMDEPTNGLDIPSKSLFRKVVAKNMTDDRTLIISTHQVHDVESLIDHVVVINQSQLLLDASVNDICDRYTFGDRPASAMDDSVLYAEPTLQGNAVVARRSEGDPETPLNLELLFNALVSEGSKLHDNR